MLMPKTKESKKSQEKQQLIDELKREMRTLNQSQLKHIISLALHLKHERQQ